WSAYTPTSADYLRKAGAKSIKPSESRFGDIIFFRNSSRICHTGYVINGYVEPPATNERFVYSQKEFISDVCKYLKVSNATNALGKTITLSAKTNKNNILVLYVQKRLKDLGLNPVMRLKNNELYVTDNGNYIADLHMSAPVDVKDIKEKLDNTVGVLETGQFLNMCNRIIVGTDDGVKIFENK
ncbi:MAG: ribose-5-phosphate isomerase A, partial [Lachnospiraceae bacterium]|nr:ribose-5-phosphate isomerase A [Lachnospiraceae bacterium]